MEKMLKHIPKSHIHVVVADREFIGKEWFRWLDTQQIPFVIRIKENALVSYRGKEIPVRKLFEKSQHSSADELVQTPKGL